MNTKDSGTPGISHTIHLGYTGDGGEFESIEEVENVVDVVNLPNGQIKLNHEGGMKTVSGSRIIRSRVKGLEHAARYRCGECESQSSDVITAMNRGDAVEMECPVCQQNTQHTIKGIEEV